MQETINLQTIKQEIDEFILEFRSVCLASLNPSQEVICSYSPFLHCELGNFIYISEISEHFESIKTHANNIEIMFLQDESKAMSAIFRKRLRYRASAEFIERGEFFDTVFDKFEARFQKANDPALAMIRPMLDFHLIKLNFTKGRFVKGPAQAFDILDNEISRAKTKKMHRMQE